MQSPGRPGQSLWRLPRKGFQDHSCEHGFRGRAAGERYSLFYRLCILICPSCRAGRSCRRVAPACDLLPIVQSGSGRSRRLGTRVPCSAHEFGRCLSARWRFDSPFCHAAGLAVLSFGLQTIRAVLSLRAAWINRTFTSGSRNIQNFLRWEDSGLVGSGSFPRQNSAYFLQAAACKDGPNLAPNGW